MSLFGFKKQPTFEDLFRKHINISVECVDKTRALFETADQQKKALCGLSNLNMRRMR